MTLQNRPKILLLNLPDMGWSGKGYSVPLGLAYLAAVLKENYPIEALDLAKNKKDCKKYYLQADEIIISHIKNIDPLLICVSCTTSNRHNVFFWAEAIKKNIPQTKIVLGGPHASVDGRAILKQIRAVDFIVVGEGEQTIKELADCVLHHTDPAKLSGVYYRDQNNQVINKPHKGFIENIDSIPFPARDVFELRDYDLHFSDFARGQALTVMTSRGCPGRCKFCSTTKFWGERYRFRSPANVLAEIKEIKNKYGLDKIIFFDDSLTGHKKRLTDLCENMIKENLNITWACWSRADVINPEIIRLMHKAGCRTISFGVESGSDKTLKNMHKHVKVSAVYEALKLCRQAGITPKITLIIGSPGESFWEALKTVYLIFRSKINPANMGINFYTMIFPGTDWCHDFTSQHHDFTWINTPPKYKKRAILDNRGNFIMPIHEFPRWQKRILMFLVKLAKLYLYLLIHPHYFARKIHARLVKTKEHQHQ